MKLNLLLLALLCCCMACQSDAPENETSSLTTYAIQPLLNSPESFAPGTDVSLLPLDKDPRLKLDETSKLRYLPDGKMLAFGEMTNAAYLLSPNGNIAHIIGAEREGPSTYPEAYDFSVSKQGKSIQVLSSGGTVYQFDFNGNFQDKLIADAAGFKLHKQADQYFLYSGYELVNETPFALYRLNEQGKSAHTYLNIKDNSVQLPIITNSEVFHESGDELYFFPNFGNTVYEIKKDSLAPFIKLDFGKRSFPDLREGDMLAKMMKLRMEEYFYLRNFIKLKNNRALIIVQHAVPGQDEQQHYFIVDQESGVSWQLPLNKLPLWGPVGYDPQHDTVIFACFGLNLPVVTAQFKKAGLEVPELTTEVTDEQIILLRIS